jgi:purine nucleosidase
MPELTSGTPEQPVPHVRILGERILHPGAPSFRAFCERVGDQWSRRGGLSAPLFSLAAILFVAMSGPVAMTQAQTATDPAPKQLVIIDSDIGDDIDDAFALALAERTPEFRILGITTAFGDTTLRAQLALRFLAATDRADIPVVAGAPTPPKTNFTQAAYAKDGDKARIQLVSGPDFLLDQIRQHPAEITLIAIGPLTNLGAAIDKDPATFRKLKRIVMMGGSVDRGYSDQTHPEPEWNIRCDIPAARKVFASGVPIDMMPLDATILKFDPARLEALFRQDTPLTRQLQTLYQEWGQKTPTLFDPMAVAYAAHPSLCPTTPMHLSVDDKGDTLRSPGEPNVNACLKSNPDAFFHYYLWRTATPISR